MSCCRRLFSPCLWMLVRVICSLCCLFFLFASIIITVDETRHRVLCYEQNRVLPHPFSGVGIMAPFSRWRPEHLRICNLVSTILFWAGEMCHKMAATVQVRACVRACVFLEGPTDKLTLILLGLITFYYDCCQIPQMKREIVIMGNQMKRLAYADTVWTWKTTLSCRSPFQLNIWPITIHDCWLAIEPSFSSAV